MEPYELEHREQLEWESRMEDNFWRRVDGTRSTERPRYDKEADNEQN